MNSLWRAASDWYHGTGNGQGGRRVREAAGNKLAQVKVDVLGEFPPHQIVDELIWLAEADTMCHGPGSFERLSLIFGESDGGIPHARGDAQDGTTARTVASFAARTGPTPTASDPDSDLDRPFDERRPRTSSGRGSHIGGTGRNADTRAAAEASAEAALSGGRGGHADEDDEDDADVSIESIGDEHRGELS
jgi:hypothetical protein